MRLHQLLPGIVVLVIAVSEATAGHYTFVHTQYGTANNQDYSLRFYREVFVNGNPEWDLVGTFQHVLTASNPEIGLYQYDNSGVVNPALGQQFSGVLIEIWDDNNQVMIDDTVSPTWVP